MSGCAALIKAIDAYIAKADDDLTEVLDESGFADSAETVKEISSIEEKIVEALTAETDYIKARAKKAVDLDEFSADWSDIKAGDDVDVKLSRIFLDEFQEQMPKLANAYIKRIDPELTVATITARTVAWAESWSKELGKYMELTTHTEVERLLTDNLQNGRSVADFTLDLMGYKHDEEGKIIYENGKPIIDKGIYDEYYRARRTALTEMLRAHSVAQQEAITQNPAVDLKELVHTGDYRNTPRPNHVTMNGVTVPKEESFNLLGANGVLYYPMYPRDPVLPPGESVNCHCIHRGIANENILGLSLEERQRLQAEAIAADDGEWEKELDAQNRAKAGIDESLYKPNEMRYAERQEMIHADILENYNLSVNTASQNKHIEGTSEYKEGRSVLTAKPQTLINKYAGKSRAITPKGVWNEREQFEHTKEIGIYKAPGGRYETPTKYGIIHYSKEHGAYIVPAKPPGFVIPKDEE